MRYLIDINIWIYLLAEKTEAVKAVKAASEAEWCGFSSISKLELLGFPDLTPVDEIKFRLILDEFNEVGITSDVIEKAIDIRKKTKIDVPDAIIAASCIIFKANLLTRNEDDFKKINEIKIVNPFKH